MMSFSACLLLRVSVSHSNNIRAPFASISGGVYVCVCVHCLKRAGFHLASTRSMTHCRFLLYYRLTAFATQSEQNVLKTLSYEYNILK